MSSELTIKEDNYNLLVDFFYCISDSFKVSSLKCGGKNDYHFMLAEHQVVISTAGKNLQLALLNPFYHLPTGVDRANEILEICVWDEKESGVKLPTIPWQWPEAKNIDSVLQFTLKNYSVVFSEGQSVFFIYDSTLNKAIVCIKDVNSLPNYFLSQPFLGFLNCGVKRVDLNILHAGCIANDKHAVLLVGRGGLGKSTSSIQCLISGLNYISDDYVLVSIGSNIPMAYSMYSSGKLNANNLKNFPKLENIAFSGKHDFENKPVLYLNKLFKKQIIYKSPIKAIVTPNITLSKNTSYTSISAFEGLKALAPSTLIQLNLGDMEDFSKIAYLVRNTPCYRLDLGSDYTTIAPAITNILNSL